MEKTMKTIPQRLFPFNCFHLFGWEYPCRWNVHIHKKTYNLLAG